MKKAGWRLRLTRPTVFSLSLWAEVPRKIMSALTTPSPLRERAGVRGNIRLWRLFRSLYVPCYSVTTIPVNVPWRLNRHRPGDPGSRPQRHRRTKASKASSAAARQTSGRQSAPFALPLPTAPASPAPPSSPHQNPLPAQRSTPAGQLPVPAG